MTKVMDHNISQDYNITPYQTDVTSHLLTSLMNIGEVMMYSEMEEVNEKKISCILFVIRKFFYYI